MFRILFKFSLPPTPTHSRCQKALTFFKFHNGVFGADDGCWYEFRCCDPAQVGAKKVFQFICGKPAFSFLFLSPRPARTSPSACSAASPRGDSGPSTRGATTCTSSTGWRSTAGRERSSRRASKRESQSIVWPDYSVCTTCPPEVTKRVCDELWLQVDFFPFRLISPAENGYESPFYFEMVSQRQKSKQSLVLQKKI